MCKSSDYFAYSLSFVPQIVANSFIAIQFYNFSMLQFAATCLFQYL